MKAESPNTSSELQRLRNRLLKQILDNQQRRESLRRDAAAAPAPLPQVNIAPTVAGPTQEAG